MKKLSTAPISGMQELLPSEQAVFNQLKSQIAETFRLHGFLSIETPTLERTEILCAKAGGDTEKQIYKVIKTTETAADADQALRFDHTVPLARYVVEHQNDLAFPFRVTQIGRNFRGERAQKGRFREFYQCDVDIIGRGTLSIAYDAEIIATLYTAIKSFLPATMKIRVSNRKILSGLLADLGLASQADAILSIIDHAEKVESTQTHASLVELGLNSRQIEILENFMDIRGDRREVTVRLQSLGIENAEFGAGVSELDQILSILASQGITAIADMLIVRGLDYYTGTVFETFLVDYPKIGSICSGGRYENLASFYTDQQLPGVGGSIGLTRLFYVLNENNLLKSQIGNPVDIAVIPITESEYDFSFSLADKLRAIGRSADVVLLDKKLGDKLKYAAKIAQNAIVIGENEAKSGEAMVKNLTSGGLTPLSELI